MFLPRLIFRYILWCNTAGGAVSLKVPSNPTEALWSLAMSAISLLNRIQALTLSSAFFTFPFFSLSFQTYSGNFRPSLTSQTSYRSADQWNTWFIAQITSRVPLTDRVQGLLSHYKHLYSDTHTQTYEWAMSAGKILVTRENMSLRVLRAPDEDEERI